MTTSTPLRRVLVLAHTGRPQAVSAATELLQRMSEVGICPVMLASEAADIPHELELVTVEHPDEVVDDVELVVVLGGDGTILRASEVVRGRDVALLGVNLGHVGFLAEIEREDLAGTVERIAARDYEVEERMTLEVVVSLGRDGDRREISRSFAVNEATVEKGNRERMLEVVTEVDGRPVSTIGCDGVVMATPTGSTAYAFSAGGPVVWPEVEALLMVPISAHACSPARSSSPPRRCSRSRSSTAPGPACCGATAAAPSSCPPARGSRSAAAANRSGSPG